ncbi:DUF4870 domain-containing protein [Arenibacter latericius]|uniref:DUF4870 domain-containing protein n=1 Tax=Arenibacter latericius TaxID=86104 RepID=UPI00040F545C|nr:DUF4870 domain-containing protein [Arenibacter latericius]MDX1362935.1 DUF4870 domain-containing protein [Arenibacter latericius]
MDQKTINEGKTMAMVSYLFVIGLIIALIVNSNKKNAFVQFHIEQSIRVWILSLIISIVLFLFSLLGIGFLGLLRWVPFGFAILGVINANSGKLEDLPLIGSIGK